MAIPPPHVFINITSARWLDRHTLEVTFVHPQCADRSVLDVFCFGVGPFVLGVQELRETRGVPTCTGPVETQTLAINVRELITDPSVQTGMLELNDAGLYGNMKRLPTIRVPFDFR